MRAQEIRAALDRHWTASDANRVYSHAVAAGLAVLFPYAIIAIPKRTLTVQ